MKKTMTITMALGIGLAVTIGTFANAGIDPGTGIYDTAHDFSRNNARPGFAWQTTDTQNRICIYCHTPHNSIKPGAGPTDDKFGGAKGVNYLPLWNHTITDFGHTLDYQLYSAGSSAPTKGDHALQASLVGNLGQPTSVSRLCLSCHDGSVAVNAYGNNAGSDTSKGAGDKFIQTGSAYMIGKNGDLRNHHPIDFDYDRVAAADKEIANPDTGVFNAKNGNITIREVLNGTIMTCVSCHDVHNTNNKGKKLIWQDDNRSAFCCVCHLKCSK